MAAGLDCGLHQHGADLYGVLGLSKECTDADLRLAYRKLAMIWHPDRCSAAGSSTCVEEAKERFQEIQGAYSVLSDSNKRFLYDVGIYDGEAADEDDLLGMGDFLGEMSQMMSQATPTDSFEDLQQLFVDMFQADIDAGFFGGPAMACTSRTPSSSPPPATSKAQAPAYGKRSHKRCSPAMDSGRQQRRASRWSQDGCGGSKRRK